MEGNGLAAARGGDAQASLVTFAAGVASLALVSPPSQGSLASFRGWAWLGGTTWTEDQAVYEVKDPPMRWSRASFMVKKTIFGKHTFTPIYINANGMLTYGDMGKWYVKEASQEQMTWAKRRGGRISNIWTRQRHSKAVGQSREACAGAGAKDTAVVAWVLGQVGEKVVPRSDLVINLGVPDGFTAIEDGLCGPTASEATADLEEVTEQGAELAAGGEPEWTQYVDNNASRRRWWFRHKDGWFFYDDDPAWEQYRDPASGRDYRWHGITGEWFYEDSGCKF